MDFVKRPDAKRILTAEAMKIWRDHKEAVFIDVRTPAEYSEGHVPGALLIPLNQLETRLNEIPRDKIVLFICQSGYRSHRANLIAQENLFDNTYMVEGGMIDWQDEIEK